MSSGSLFLCHRIPFPPNKGDKIRSYALLKHLAGLGPVHVGCFVDEKEDFKYLDEVRALAGGDCLFIPLGAMAKWSRSALALAMGQPITTAYFGSSRLGRWVADILAAKQIENIVVFGSAMAPYLMGRSPESGRVLFDMVDVDSDKWRQYATASRGLARWIYAREAQALERLEREAVRRFGKTLLVSHFEAETFRAIAPLDASHIESLNNGVDLDRFSPRNSLPNPFPVGEQAIVMTGRMDYRPNFGGAIWFAKQVAPFIFDRLPTAHLYFVGSNPPSSLLRLAGARITVTGDVDDVRPYIQHAAAIVAPLQLARGVQNKVLEAMAMEKAVVATHEATRALDVTNGQHLWIENDPIHFADAVVRAVQSPAHGSVMRNARKYVEDHHNWTAIFRELDIHLAELSARRSPKMGNQTCYGESRPQPAAWHRKVTEVEP